MDLSGDGVAILNYVLNSYSGMLGPPEHSIRGVQNSRIQNSRCIKKGSIGCSSSHGQPCLVVAVVNPFSGAVLKAVLLRYVT